ncbi:multicopper oxidase domain-containing protein [Actinomadura sp. PM05-2]|uniref:Multicopper oxidase domain-containing protein n=1 Tax=Actinomadura parmotrematis TaxID=2864039 RepID=A0ABS7FRA7_9ACTN|nr:multicopper oxidase domain-containing protein [Actinomadura parmotrematis]
MLGPAGPGRPLASEHPLPRPFQRPLTVPPVLAPVRTDATTDHYEITQRTADLHILDDAATPAWTYGGTFPGPTLVSRSGRRTVVVHRNRLPRPVAVHLHGGHTPHDSDGHPGDAILPPGGDPMDAMPGMAGGTATPGRPVTGERAYAYPLDQRAATLWYHDHRMGFTGASVWLGLAGFHLVHDDEEDALPLPKGDRDLPLMIADRSFAADGAFRYPALDRTLRRVPGVTARYTDGVRGDVILVNGTPWPVHPVPRLRHRLRLLNASNARAYRLALDPPPPGGGGLVQIGGDGGLLAAPAAHDAIDVAPAERFDVVVDFARYRPGTRVRLVNRLATGPAGQVMAFDVAGTAARPAEDATVPARLSDVPRHDPARAAVTRSFLFQNTPDGWHINGRGYDPARPLARPRLGDLEVWRLVSDAHHPVHLHLDHFQVVSRNGRAPGPYDGGWKDTVDVRPAEAVEIAVRFTRYAGRFVFHCHNLEHEDMAMMADFITS